MATDRGVVEDDVAIRMPACGCDRLVAQALGTGAGSAYLEQQGRRARRALRGRRAGFNTLGGRGVQLAEKVKGERVGGIPGVFARRRGVVVATHVLSSAVLARCGRATAFWSAAGKLPRRPARC